MSGLSLSREQASLHRKRCNECGVLNPRKNYSGCLYVVYAYGAHLAWGCTCILCGCGCAFFRGIVSFIFRKAVAWSASYRREVRLRTSEALCTSRLAPLLLSSWVKWICAYECVAWANACHSCTRLECQKFDAPLETAALSCNFTLCMFSLRWPHFCVLSASQILYSKAWCAVRKSVMNKHMLLVNLRFLDYAQ